MTATQTEFQLFSETWKKDTIDLLDYDSTSLIKSSFTSSEPFNVYFNNNQVSFSKKEIQSYRKLFQIGIKDSNYYIQTNKYELDSKNQNEKGLSAWFVYKTSKCPEKSKKYLLNKGDIIKIGKIIMLVKEIKVDKYNNEINFCPSMHNSNMPIIKPNIKDQQDTKSMQNTLKLSINHQKSKRVCRICYTEDNTDESPLIQPCKCSGSLKYIHLLCLKKWIETKLCVKIYSNENSANYSINNIECELCKVKFPDMIRHNGKLYELTSLNSGFDKYIILETLTCDKQFNTKNLFVISFDNKTKVNIGRGKDSHLILNDISVSRIHCFFHHEGKNIYVEDNDSKFGTLILIQNPMLMLYSNISLHFQVGRSYFFTKIKEPFSLFSCCNVSTKFDYKEYQRQNSLKITLDHGQIVKEEEMNYDESEYESEMKCITKEIEKEEIIRMESSLCESENTVNNEDKGLVLLKEKNK